MKSLRKILLFTATALSIAAAASLSYSQGNFEGVELSITPVAGNVYMVQR